MNFRLKIEPKESLEEDFGKKRFTFAVIDLDRSESYPLNFVCMLPKYMGRQGRMESAFEKVFGDKSFEQAKALLKAAWESEGDPQVRAEIDRRLALLEHKPVSLVTCSGCGKFFKPGYLRVTGGNSARSAWQKSTVAEPERNHTGSGVLDSLN